MPERPRESAKAAAATGAKRSSAAKASPFGSLGTVGASLDFTMCLQPSCFGNFDLNMAFDYTTHGKTFTFNVPIHADWSFDYTDTYTSSFNESGQVGNTTLGLKGSMRL